MAKILIVGAGLAGLVAARELQNAGHETILLEQNAIAGGRMATQSIGEALFDSGAQFFTARSAEFQAALAHWLEGGLAREWFRGYPAPRAEKSEDAHPRFCGARGMSCLTQFLARGLDIQFQTEIKTLVFENRVWAARTASGWEYSGDFLILTAPIPQSLLLFDSSRQVLPAPLRAQLESVHYEPCLALLATCRSAELLPAPGALHINEEPIAWLADNFQKEISSQPGSLTIHSTGRFAREHWEADESLLAEKLFSAARRYFAAPVEIEDFQVRRWRFSRPQNALDAGAVFVSDLNVCFAGDGLCGARIEGAFCSGLMAARVPAQK